VRTGLSLPRRCSNVPSVGVGVVGQEREGWRRLPHHVHLDALRPLPPALDEEADIRGIGGDDVIAGVAKGRERRRQTGAGQRQLHAALDVARRLRHRRHRADEAERRA
jgi:hypothetical protein